jgi:hypothetical protein
MSGGVRGKYHERYRAGVRIALLEPEVAKAFPTRRDPGGLQRRRARAVAAEIRPDLS